MPVLLSLLTATLLCPTNPTPALVSASGQAIVTIDSTSRALFERGTPYAEFLANAKARRDLWQRNSSWTTPTVLLLDADYTERGAFIERPAELQQWMLAQRGVLSDAEANARKMVWYDGDKGIRTLTEIVELMEQAGRRPLAR